jgi:PleD family two-component response regulator
VAEKLRTLTADMQILNNHNITVTIGAAELRSGENVDNWYKRCDDALYAAKNDGRNRVMLAAYGNPAVRSAVVS